MQRSMWLSKQHDARLASKAAALSALCSSANLAKEGAGCSGEFPTPDSRLRPSPPGERRGSGLAFTAPKARVALVVLPLLAREPPSSL
mmetsp:Transcript_12939/g.22539  ORF Transcript_12939/g.22539 Transcript_12939/m.22539 type:complete len:88 (-) Transcript_12939:365-628(-)